ncbi:MAG: twin-arginine translocation signal domain-containing protein, partial [Chitinophagaceae bacterium]
MEKDSNQSSRRKFIHQTALAGAGMMLINPLDALAQNNE